MAKKRTGHIGGPEQAEAEAEIARRELVAAKKTITRLEREIAKYLSRLQQRDQCKCHGCQLHRATQEQKPEA